ncbi:hypothetical protein [Streptomyces brevispora]|uniref:Uncharacterized protein n=1 Tax=Streptomyces brevispora TaxID=887462 RepID=A0A561TUJ9_9ACTN|nr:hypothetical protein [Streptomyces brevispora]TWF90789.1 hypothetical protein FHX80_13205 [Streptomyces brevispora]
MGEGLGQIGQGSELGAWGDVAMVQVGLSGLGPTQRVHARPVLKKAGDLLDPPWNEGGLEIGQPFRLLADRRVQLGVLQVDEVAKWNLAALSDRSPARRSSKGST